MWGPYSTFDVWFLNTYRICFPTLVSCDGPFVTTLVALSPRWHRSAILTTHRNTILLPLATVTSLATTRCESLRPTNTILYPNNTRFERQSIQANPSLSNNSPHFVYLFCNVIGRRRCSKRGFTRPENSVRRRPTSLLLFCC